MIGPLKEFIICFQDTTIRPDSLEHDLSGPLMRQSLATMLRFVFTALIVSCAAAAPTLVRREGHAETKMHEWNYDRCDQEFGPAAWPISAGV